MHPDLFRIGNFVFSTFGAMLALAFVAAYAQLSWGLRRLGAGDADDAAALVFAAIAGGIVGAKVYYAILYHDWRLLFDRAGLVWYGGFILGAAGILWVMRRRHLAPWATADAAAPALALGYGLGRIGCFLVGDDYGVPTDLPWGVKFPQGRPPTRADVLASQFGVHIPAGVPGDRVLAVHPTQLYETTLALAIWGVGLWMLRRGFRRGTTALTVLALLAVERFAVEFLRAKDDRLLGTFTLAQVISVAVLLVVLVLAWRRRSRDGTEAIPRSGEG